MAYVSSAAIGSRTNGQRSFTYFNVTRGPEGGEIYLNDAPASIFSQVSLEILQRCPEKCLILHEVDPSWRLLALVVCNQL